MTDAVRDIILKPMQEMYLPPPHLRQNAEARARALAAYERILAPFSAGTLQSAWDKVVAEHTYWGIWPSCAAIVQAARQCQPRPTPPPTDEQRKAQAFALADAYAAQFMTSSQLAKLARREGWAGRLREYVTDAAWVQAQLICGVRDIGWNPGLAEGLGRFHSSADAFAAYRKTIETPVQSGSIDVRIPSARICQWQQQASHGQAIDTDTPEEIAAHRA